MKVLLCHDFYRQRSGEMAAVEAQDTLLTTHGHNVVRLTRDNREIDEMSWSQRVHLPFDAVYSAGTARQVESMVAQEAPDLAHVHNVYPLLSPSLYRSLSKAGIPIVQTLHNFRFLCPNGLFFTHGQVCERCRYGNTLHAVRLRCYRDSYAASATYAASIGLHRRAGTFDGIDRFLALTPFHAEKVVEAGLVSAERVEVLGNFLTDPPNPLPEREREGYVLFLGRLSHEKGVDLAIRAAAELPTLRLRIAGEGPERERLARLAADATDGGRVELLGFRSGAEKNRLLRGAAALVIPSRWYEGLPYSALEAWACGVPVVAAAHGGLGRIVSAEEVGLSHVPDDIRSLASALERITSDHRLRQRLGHNARQLFERRYTATAHYERLLEIYRQVSP